MTQAIEYSLISQSGSVRQGEVLAESGSNNISLASGDHVSLHIDRSHIFAVVRDGGNLVVVLLDGRKITFEGYYLTDADLYISSDGELYHVSPDDGDPVVTGSVSAQYDLVEVGGKWSPYDQLVFEDDVILLEPETASVAPVFALNPLVAGGLTLGSLIAGGGDSGASNVASILPTVDNPDNHLTITTNTPDPAAVVTGTGEPGSSVKVALGERSLTTTVGADGTWGVTFRDGTLPPDGDMTSSVTVIAPDGTTYNLDGPDFLIDMTPPDVMVTEGAVSTADVESYAEYSDGISIVGTGEVGASISVEVRGQMQMTTVAADGTWKVTFTHAQLPDGNYTEPMKITATDINGNITVLNDTLEVDTKVSPFTHGTATPNSILVDDIVNHAEATGGLVVTGTVEAGSTVTVQLANGTPVQAQVTGTTWTATIPAGSLPKGEHQDVVLTVGATDPNGNTASQTSKIDFDTVVRNFAVNTQVAGDGVVNATEASNGFAITGTAEVGSSVVVALTSGATQTVTADNAGNWSVTFGATDLQGASGSVAFTVTATDPAGNSAVLNDAATQGFTYDLQSPKAPVPNFVTLDPSGDTTTALFISPSEGPHLTISTVASNGTVATVMNAEPLVVGSSELYSFPSAVPNGSYLVITDTDTAGNEASTLLVVDSNIATTFDLDRPGLEKFDISSINLESTQASLTITGADILSLTGPENTLIISGDANDSVTALGAQDTGQDTVVGGQTHSIYTVGDDGATLLIDDQISNLTI